jgi:hypothetical protein
MPSISLPVAVLGSAALGTAGSLIGGSQAAGAASHASDVQRQMYETTRNDLMPYNTGGQGDFGAYNRLITGPPSQMEAQLQGLPGYQFTRTQGLKGVQNSATARGLGVSGAALKGAATFATGLADSTFGAQANRLLQGAALGENAAAQTGNTAAGIAGGVGQAITNSGAAAAAGTSGAFNNLGQGIVGYGMYGGGAGAGPGPGLPFAGTPFEGLI